MRCLRQQTIPHILFNRKSKGLSQQELAIQLNVVRQTISKWEQGLSVPDSDMLISISEVLEVPVSTLLGETVVETKVDDLKVLSEKLEIINLQLAQKKIARRKIMQGLLIALCSIIVIISAALIALNSPYLSLNYNDPETAVFGAGFHIFEWLFAVSTYCSYWSNRWNFLNTKKRIKSLYFSIKKAGRPSLFNAGRAASFRFRFRIVPLRASCRPAYAPDGTRLSASRRNTAGFFDSAHSAGRQDNTAGLSPWKRPAEASPQWLPFHNDARAPPSLSKCQAPALEPAHGADWQRR